MTLGDDDNKSQASSKKRAMQFAEKEPNSPSKKPMTAS